MCCWFVLVRVLVFGVAVGVRACALVRVCAILFVVLGPQAVRACGGVAEVVVVRWACVCVQVFDSMCVHNHHLVVRGYACA